MKKFINYTPHIVRLNDGAEFPSQGVARVAASFTDADENGICFQQFGEVTGLPEKEEGVLIIVSAMVMEASNRDDLVAPATGHPETIRNSKGHIVSVPCFVRKGGQL